AHGFANGALHLVAIEQFIEKVDIQGDAAGDTTLLRADVAPLLAERPLTRDTFGRALALIRQMSGVSADIHFKQGSGRGAVRLVIAVRRKSVAVTVNANNRGTALLGRTAIVAHASAYNVTGEGEQLGIVYATSTSTGRFRYVAADISEAIG